MLIREPSGIVESTMGFESEIGSPIRSPIFFSQVSNSWEVPKSTVVGNIPKVAWSTWVSWAPMTWISSFWSSRMIGSKGPKPTISRLSR